jgi:hypothetical protein
MKPSPSGFMAMAFWGLKVPSAIAAPIAASTWNDWVV